MGTNDRQLAPERSCILTRRTAPKTELIRLALGPDGQVAPDIRAKAPGRGAYIGVNKAELEEAMAKGKLKPALARAFKDGKAVAPDTLADDIEAALERNALDRMGLEARGGTLINGSEKVEKAARSGKLYLLLHAADASEDGNKRLDQAWRVGGGDQRGLVLLADRTMLSSALGRENVVHVGLTDQAAAKRVREALSRWHAFLEPHATLEGGASAALAAENEDEGSE
ncbi:DUF448 domain-containing protein [Sphingomicrobium marinum]|uniref:DUF448 domain-containing protein n=1 Tax=Sphingomicrobium marinum TaxID=1227950 RepID=UPI0022400832|nr:DUF448 domain-containing protein [Sphingomicrobium marinum]